MWNQIALSFVTGLSVGPVCLLHCGLFQAAFIARHAPSGRRRAFGLGGAMLAGRLAAYLLLGILVGLLAGSRLWIVRPWVPTALLGALMLAYAAMPRRAAGDRRCACGSAAADARISPAVTGGALLIGFLSGISPCPPMLGSALIALQSRGLTAAILVFVAFFAGSSLFLVPFLFGAGALGPAGRNRLRNLSRLLAAGVALYAGISLARQWRASHAAPRVLASPPHRPNGPGRGRPQAAGLPAAGPARAPAIAPAAPATEAPLRRVSDPRPAPPSLRPLYRKPWDHKRFTEALVRKLNLSLHEAMFYQALPGKNVQCRLCPRGCTLANGQRGLCKVRVNIDGMMRTLTYARPVAVHIDPIEKKPLFHVLPGSSALSIATVGCNSGCVFCQNFEISQALPEDVRRVVLPPEKVVAIALERGDAGIAYTYTEATIFFEYMYDTATLAHANGLKNYWITCGQIRPGPLRRLCKVIDAANVDLKGFSDEFYVKYCDFRLQPVLETLRILKQEGVFVEITNLVIPGANDDPKLIRTMCRWIVQELGPDTPLHFSRFHPAYKLTRTPPTPAATLIRARDIAREEGLHFVYIGNVRTPDGGMTRCPKCGKVILRRLGYLTLENHIEHGKCAFCGTPVAGIWKK